MTDWPGAESASGEKVSRPVNDFFSSVSASLCTVKCLMTQSPVHGDRLQKQQNQMSLYVVFTDHTRQPVT